MQMIYSLDGLRVICSRVGEGWRFRCPKSGHRQRTTEEKERGAAQKRTGGAHDSVALVTNHMAETA